MFPSAVGKDVLEVILFLIAFGSGIAYNLDTVFPIVYNGSEGSYFGFTTALHRNKWGSLALVGAPKSNTTTFRESVYQPGTLFRCNITESNEKQSCEEVVLMTEGAKYRSYRDKFEYIDKKDGMWLGVSLDARENHTENAIVVCGHLWKNQYFPQKYLVGGVCYTINKDLDKRSVKKLLPLIQRTRRYYGEVYDHAHGQAGMSAVFSESGSNLILGAPGIFSWTGSIVDYSMNTFSSGISYRSPTPAYGIEYNSYFGYSVTTGTFFQPKEELYAVGAPREGMNNGKIFIFKLDKEKMKIVNWKQGFQLGEYFGYSILGVDVNGDSFTDLLVGAPLNTISLESGGDEGKVYVYVSTGRDFHKPDELVGDRKNNSRFGTALANIGDLNQDGYNDIAVGAPYEDGKGAVYIYHCSKSGVKLQYTQKIEAASTGPNLSGFGIHISRGLDIDDNGYPDILVGSYSSSNAVLFRSRPVIRVFPMIRFIPMQISTNQTDCEFNGENLTCVKIDACLWYSGRSVPSRLEFEFSIVILDNRGFLTENGSKASTSTQTKFLDGNMKTCLPFQLHLNSNIKDYLTPINVRFSNSLVPPKDSMIHFNKAFPVYHPSSPTNITSEIPFHTGCGGDECRSDLTVSATRTRPLENTTVITLGTFSRISVTVSVSNQGEPAYLSEMLVFVPPELSIINQDCESVDQQNNVNLTCSLGNPLKNGTKVEVHFILDASEIPPHTKYLEMTFLVVTNSTEINPDDNIEQLPFHLESVSDTGIKGLPSDQVMYSEKCPSPFLTHSYVVTNYGPSPLQTIDIEIRVPYAFSTSDGPKPFLTYLEPNTGSQFSVSAVCDDSSLKTKKIDPTENEEGKYFNRDILSNGDEEEIPGSFTPQNLRLRRDLSHKSDVSPTELEVEEEKRRNGTVSPEFSERTLVSCDTPNIICTKIRCSAGKFSDRNKNALISVELQLDFDVMNDHLKKWYHIEFISTASISVPDTAVIERGHHPEIAQVATAIVKGGPPPTKEVSAWIIFVSIGVGILLLIILLIILARVGFFKRKEKDRMEKMKNDGKQAEDNPQQGADDAEILKE